MKIVYIAEIKCKVRALVEQLQEANDNKLAFLFSIYFKVIIGLERHSGSLAPSLNQATGVILNARLGSALTEQQKSP
jgi:hypothetical protein